MLRGALRRRWRVALALLVLGTLLAPIPLSTSGAAEYPRHSPASLAHILADYSSHRDLDPTVGAWWVEEERSNYTWWEYAVRYECGARCSGRAEVHAGALQAGHAHGPASRHRLLLRDRRCLTLPLLPWPSVCRESETEMEVSEREGGGSRLQHRATVACGVLSALGLGCQLPALHIAPVS